jgi:hypothetical protein
MKHLLSLVLVCAACDDPGLVGPVPGGDPGCTQRMVADGGTTMPFAVDQVVAGSDLTRLKDSSFAAAVERFDGTTRSVAVAFTDSARTTLSFDVAASATVRPLPRLAVSSSDEPALMWRDADGTLALGTRTGRTTIAGSAGAQQPALAWADVQAPLVVWISADGQDIVSSAGPVSTGLGWTAMAAIEAPAGGVIVCGIGHRHIAFFQQSASGSVAAVLDAAIDTIAGPLFVRGANPPEIYYVSVIPRLAKEQAYLLTAAGGATGRPVASPTTDVPTEIFANGHLWVLDGDQLTWLANGTPPVAVTLVDANAAVVEPQPLVMLGDGDGALAVVRNGRLEVDFFSAMLVCR